MSSVGSDPRSTVGSDPRSTPGVGPVRGMGRAVFVGILLLIVGTLNLFYGIAAVANSSFYVAEERYVFSGLHTWGWITIVLGAIQLTAALSLFAGNLYGRVIAIFAATLGAIEALANVGGPHPWWSLGVFAVCLWVIYGIWVLGEPENA
jgi:uncharacterized membrane protein